jgi:hypothetical protein
VAVPPGAVYTIVVGGAGESIHQALPARSGGRGGYGYGPGGPGGAPSYTDTSIPGAGGGGRSAVLLAPTCCSSAVVAAAPRGHGLPTHHVEWTETWTSAQQVRTGPRGCRFPVLRDSVGHAAPPGRGPRTSHSDAGAQCLDPPRCCRTNARSPAAPPASSASCSTARRATRSSDEFAVRRTSVLVSPGPVTPVARYRRAEWVPVFQPVGTRLPCLASAMVAGTAKRRSGSARPPGRPVLDPPGGAWRVCVVRERGSRTGLTASPVAAVRIRQAGSRSTGRTG